MTTLVLGDAADARRHAQQLLATAPSVLVIHPGEDGGGLDTSSYPQDWQHIASTDVTRTILRAREPVIVDDLPTWVSVLISHAQAWDDELRAAETVQSAMQEFTALWSAAPYPAVALSTQLPEVGEGHDRLWAALTNTATTMVGATTESLHWVVAGRIVDLSSSPRLAL